MARWAAAGPSPRMGALVRHRSPGAGRASASRQRLSGDAATTSHSAASQQAGGAAGVGGESRGPGAKRQVLDFTTYETDRTGQFGQ